jgi:hypothetical protein
MPNLPVLSESTFPYFALGFGVIGFVALKVWGRIFGPQAPPFQKASSE